MLFTRRFRVPDLTQNNNPKFNIYESQNSYNNPDVAGYIEPLSSESSIVRKSD